MSVKIGYFIFADPRSLSAVVMFFMRQWRVTRVRYFHAVFATKMARRSGPFDFSVYIFFKKVGKWDFLPHPWDILPFQQSYRNHNNNHNHLHGPVVYSPVHIPLTSPP
jgi:hypothetical protein